VKDAAIKKNHGEELIDKDNSIILVKVDKRLEKFLENQSVVTNTTKIVNQCLMNSGKTLIKYIGLIKLTDKPNNNEFSKIPCELSYNNLKKIDEDYKGKVYLVID
jgi:hypothetical protein